MFKYFLLIVVFYSSIVQAQGDKPVTLTVTGQGKTHDEATQNALRSAIEQAFGTFISSKTEILDDKLVMDEIISVANGNIQNYDVISEVQLPDGDYAISLKAVVSVTKLTSFVENKGVVTEFKGSILAANIKQQMLNEENENKAISNIASVCKTILDRSCDFEIMVGVPKQKNNDNNKWAIPLTVNVKFNKNIENFKMYFSNSIRGLSMSSKDVTKYHQLGKKTYKIALGESSNGGSKIYHFRTLSAVTSIIDLILYTKHAVLNFQIENGRDKITPEKLITDLKNCRFRHTMDKCIGYGVKIINDKLTPIFNSRCDFWNFKYTSNGPNGLFRSYNGNGNTGCGKSSSKFSLYNPVNNYSRNFYYNGGRSKEFHDLYYLKYNFLTKLDNELPEEIQKLNPYFDKGKSNESEYGFQAVISLFDFTTDFTPKREKMPAGVFEHYSKIMPVKNNIINFYFEDILSLNDIEKVKEYKIYPDIKREDTNTDLKTVNSDDQNVVEKTAIKYNSIIIGSFGAVSNAEKLKKSLLNEGFKNIDISKVGNINRVSILVSGSKEDAQELLKKVKVNHKTAWISYN